MVATSAITVQEPTIAIGSFATLIPATNETPVSSSSQVLVLAGGDRRAMEDMGAKYTLRLSSEDLAIAIGSHRDELSWLASENCLIQHSLDLFRDALQMCARNVLADRDNFGKLERILTNIIAVVSLLDESMLADTLFVHLEMIRSLFTQPDRLKNRG